MMVIYEVAMMTCLTCLLGILLGLVICTSFWEGRRRGNAECQSASEWTLDRQPDEDEYIDRAKGGYKRFIIALKTDTIMYDTACYDGRKWFTEYHGALRNDVVAWQPLDEIDWDVENE